MRPLPLLGAPTARAPEGPPAIAAKGFRPFFLLAAVLASAFLPVWLLAFAGHIRVGTYVDAASWHAHEMLFGFTMAVVAGFLLTAVGNWTGRETAIGKPLLALAALWAAGRVAMLAPGLWPGLVAAVELAFVPALAITIARPLVAARNRRNAVMVVVLSALWVADLAFHLDVAGLLPDGRRRALLFAVDLLVLLVVVVGARVFPMFTRNATGVASIASRPRLDTMAALCVASMALVDVLRGPATHPLSVGPLLSAALAALGAVLLLARSWSWGARASLRDPMLWVLHVGHAWIVVGLALRALAIALPSLVNASAATHALTAGAIGTTTLGMMARVALGHTGRKITASRAVALAFVLVSAAAGTRVLVPIVAPRLAYGGIVLAGLMWTTAFALYVAVYTPILVRPRVDGKAG